MAGRARRKDWVEACLAALAYLVANLARFYLANSYECVNHDGYREFDDVVLLKEVEKGSKCAKAK